MAGRVIIPAKFRNLFDWTCPKCACVFTTHAAPCGESWSCVKCGHRADVGAFFVAARIFTEPTGRTIEEMAPVDPSRTPADRANEHQCDKSRAPFITYDAPMFCPHCGERV